jgi:hypothetical protein
MKNTVFGLFVGFFLLFSSLCSWSFPFSKDMTGTPRANPGDPVFPGLFCYQGYLVKEQNTKGVSSSYVDITLCINVYPCENGPLPWWNVGGILGRQQKNCKPWGAQLIFSNDRIAFSGRGTNSQEYMQEIDGGMRYLNVSWNWNENAFDVYYSTKFDADGFDVDKYRGRVVRGDYSYSDPIYHPVYSDFTRDGKVCYTGEFDIIGKGSLYVPIVALVDLTNDDGHLIPRRLAIRKREENDLYFLGDLLSDGIYIENRGSQRDGSKRRLVKFEKINGSSRTYSFVELKCENEDCSNFVQREYLKFGYLQLTQCPK